MTITYQDGTTSTFDLPDGGGLSAVNTEDPVEGDGSTATPVALTDTAKHSLSQIPALEERTQDLAIEDTYVWADTTDGVISLRSDAPPSPWLQTTIWGATYSYSSQDAGADNTYIVMRIGNSEEVNQFRVEVTKGSNTFYYNGAAFRRIHKSETSPPILRASPLELAVRRRATGPKGHGHRRGNRVPGPRRRRILHGAGRDRQSS